jgi:hypothetical protein
LSRQSQGKIVEWGRPIRMGWRPELQSLPIERNAFIEVSFLTSFLKSGFQFQSAIDKWRRLIRFKLGFQSLSLQRWWDICRCSKNYIHIPELLVMPTMTSTDIGFKVCVWLQFFYGQLVDRLSHHVMVVVTSVLFKENIIVIRQEKMMFFYSHLL